MPLGSSALGAASALGALFGGSPPPPPASPAAPPAALQLVIQPGDGGPMEDWMNLERLRVEGVPMVCLNGALDKVRFLQSCRSAIHTAEGASFCTTEKLRLAPAAS